ncbi:Hypothetical predicted protein [Olea europaea subsp. europaea]|uniref:Uncharacterized protein n=1 Tax=Olea europaea subsp. europaea TaxID=158383 RepID=A0A8S0V607_OLEEU|nr:Hypothetical predicted protein [Olea europaea subsp. europaea]
MFLQKYYTGGSFFQSDPGDPQTVKPEELSHFTKGAIIGLKVNADNRGYS